MNNGLGNIGGNKKEKRRKREDTVYKKIKVKRAKKSKREEIR
jgi:hypothetical protein